MAVSLGNSTTCGQEGRWLWIGEALLRPVLAYCSLWWPVVACGGLGLPVVACGGNILPRPLMPDRLANLGGRSLRSGFTKLSVV